MKNGSNEIVLKNIDRYVKVFLWTELYSSMELVVMNGEGSWIFTGRG